MSSSQSPQRLPGVAVYCPSSLGNEEAFQAAAVSIGKAIAEVGRPLIYGGGTRGLMGVVASTVLENGGRVIGVSPYAMIAAGGEREKTNKEVKESAEVLTDERRRGKSENYETVVVSSMHERKLEMTTRAGGFIGLPGGYGTLEEVLEATTWNQLDIHNKPVVLLNVLSYYTPLKELIRNGIAAGFIQASSANLVVFIDEPSEPSEKEAFDWGTEALRALDAWTRDPSTAFRYDWSKGTDFHGKPAADKERNI